MGEEHKIERKQKKESKRQINGSRVNRDDNNKKKTKTKYVGPKLGTKKKNFKRTVHQGRQLKITRPRQEILPTLVSRVPPPLRLWRGTLHSTPFAEVAIPETKWTN